MPRATELPEPLQQLALCQALDVTHKRFRIDTEQVIEAVKSRLEELATETKRTWDRTTFLEAARRARGASLAARLAEVLDWTTARYPLRWGKGAKYGTAQILPKGGASTALSIDTTGMVYVYMDDLERMGVFGSLADREAFVDRLNTVQGLAIARERAGNKFIGFQIGNVDREDVAQLLSKIDAELQRIAS